MTPSLWVTLFIGIFVLCGTLATVLVALRNNRETLEARVAEMTAQSHEDLAADQLAAREQDEKRRLSERDENLAEARRLRDEVRVERDRIAAELAREKERQAAEQKRVADEARFAAIEREEFRQEISQLQADQRTLSQERAHHSEVIAALSAQHLEALDAVKDQLAAQHAEEMAALRRGHASEMEKLSRKILTMEARIRELEGRQ